MVLCLGLERNLPPAKYEKAMPYFVRREYPWLEPPPLPAEYSVRDLYAAPDPVERGAIAERYAHAVWRAWSAHHPTVRGWLDQGVAVRRQITK